MNKFQTYFERMIQLADEVFGMRQDPTQISVNRKVRSRLLKIHPSSLTEKRTKRGPIAWVLIFPTTKDLMRSFIKKQITEKELLEKTPFNIRYETIYLCSALVLPEYRRKGIAKKLMCKAIKSIQKNHPIKSLFYWAFTKEGGRLAVSVAKELSLPLYKRTV
jgi:ribosomal protein S18 acetylase RimI-like enzyme